MRVFYRKTVVMVTAVLILWGGCWVGARSLTVDTIWYDEWYSLYYAGAAPHYGPISPADTLSRMLQYNEYNPPGYYIALNLWGHIIGWTPFAGRLFSLLLGVLALAVMFRLGHDLGGFVGGIGASVALGLSAFFVNQLHELRMYTLFPLLVALVLLLYWRLCHRRAGLWSALAFFASLLGLLYTHYLALPFVIALAIYHLVFAPKTRTWLLVAGLALAAGLLYLPWLSVAFAALNTVSGESSRNYFASDALTLINNVLTQFSNGVVPLLVLVGWYALKAKRQHIRFVGGLLVMTFGVVLALNERLRFIGIARYLLALWPLLALVVALGVMQMARLKLRPAIVLVVWGLAGIGLILPRTLIPEPKDPHWQVYLPWDQVAAQLDSQLFGSPDHPDVLAYLLPHGTPYWFHAPLVDYYLHNLGVQVDEMPAWLALPVPPKPAVRAHLVQSDDTTTPDAFAQDAAHTVADAQRVWLAYDPTLLPSPFARPAWQTTLTQQGLTACSPIVASDTLRMDLYARVNTVGLSASFGHDIRVGMLNDAVPRGGILPVLLGWTIAPNTPPDTYSIGLYVEDAHGRPVAQTDFGIPTGPIACSRAAIALNSIPAGAYSISAVVYRWQSGERLVGQSTIGQVADRPRLASFVAP